MPNNETTAFLPPKWADDPLTEYANQAFRNLLATFVHKKSRFDTLIQLDGHYFEIAKNLSHASNILTPLFVMRSHSAYRPGCQLTSGGQIVESFCVLRACLECALYCFHIHENDSLGEVWLRRHDDAASLATVKKEFTYRKVISTLRHKDPRLCSTIESLYERTIDFGGHPNERSITSSMTMESSDKEVTFQQIYLHGDSLSLDHGLKTAAQVGLGALYVLRHVFRERFDILDITTHLDELREHL